MPTLKINKETRGRFYCSTPKHHNDRKQRLVDIWFIWFYCVMYRGLAIIGLNILTLCTIFVQMRESNNNNNNSNKQKNIYIYTIKVILRKHNEVKKTMQNIISSRKKNTSKHNTVSIPSLNFRFQCERVTKIIIDVRDSRTRE